MAALLIGKHHSGGRRAVRGDGRVQGRLQVVQSRRWLTHRGIAAGAVSNLEINCNQVLCISLNNHGIICIFEVRGNKVLYYLCIQDPGIVA